MFKIHNIQSRVYVKSELHSLTGYICLTISIIFDKHKKYRSEI